MVVSEINDKLSPNIAPPITVAINSCIESPVCSPIAKPIGARATIVPTEVPIAKDIKHAIMNKPITNKFCGKMDSAKFTVASIAPIPFAVSENAPASKKIITINITFEFPAPVVKISIFFVIVSLRFMKMATALAIEMATITGNA